MLVGRARVAVIGSGGERVQYTGKGERVATPWWTVLELDLFYSRIISIQPSAENLKNLEDLLAIGTLAKLRQKEFTGHYEKE